MTLDLRNRSSNETHLYVAGVASSGNVTIATTCGYSFSPWAIAVSPLDADWLEFCLLAAQWKRETGMLSSRAKKISSRLYRRIIEMGKDRAVPQILRQIKKEGANPDHWWPALEELTKQNPIPVEAANDIRKVARIWVDWGRVHYAGKLGPE
jgi:hypothetical protein